MLQRRERDRGSQAGGLLDRGAGAGGCGHRLRSRYDAPPGAGGRFQGARRARDRQEVRGLHGAGPDARPDRVIDRWGGGGARAIRDRTPAPRDRGGAAAGTAVAPDAGGGRGGITDRGCSPATARDRYSAWGGAIQPLVDGRSAVLPRSLGGWLGGACLPHYRLDDLNAPSGLAHGFAAAGGHYSRE